MAVLSLLAQQEQMYNEYIAAVGKYKLDSAQADLAEAQAELTQAQIGKVKQEIEAAKQLVKAKKLAVDELQTNLEAFKQEASKASAEIKQMEKWAKSADRLRTGGHIDNGSFQNAMAAFRLLLPHASLQAVKLIRNKPLSAKARAAKNFINVRDDGKAVEPAPSDVENALELIAWMGKMHYMANMGSAAYDEVAEVFDAISTEAQQRIKEMKDQLDRSRKGENDALNPGAILGMLVTGGAGQRILT